MRELLWLNVAYETAATKEYLFLYLKCLYIYIFFIHNSVFCMSPTSSHFWKFEANLLSLFVINYIYFYISEYAFKLFLSMYDGFFDWWHSVVGLGACWAKWAGDCIMADILIKP